MRRRQRGLRLLDLEQRFDAGGIAIAGQRVDLIALLERRLRNVELQVSALQLNIGVRDIDRQDRTLWLEFFQNRDWPTSSALAVLLLVTLALPIALFRRQAGSGTR